MDHRYSVLSRAERGIGIMALALIALASGLIGGFIGAALALIAGALWISQALPRKTNDY